MAEKKQARVIMLCCPRSTSTLFARSMTAVPGSQIFMDSYFFCHEAISNLKLMGKSVDDDDLRDEDWRKAAEMIFGEEIGWDNLDISKLKYEHLKHALDNPPKEAPLVFCKTVSFPIMGRYHYLPDKSSNYRYTFLLRHPLRVFKSHRKALFDMVNALPELYPGSNKSWEEFDFMSDVPEKYIFEGRFFKELYEQWMYVKENIDPDPVVIDSDDVLSDPKLMISKYCTALGIPYSDSMTEWDGDPRHVDDWWMPVRPYYKFRFGLIFSGKAIFSKKFLKPDELPSLGDLTDDIKESYEIVKPYYEEMYNARMKP